MVVVVMAAGTILAGCGRSAPEEVAGPLEASLEPSSTVAVVTTLPVTTVPPPTTTPEYIVQQGDSLSVIAQRFGVSTEDLANFNGIEDSDTIKVGQTLTIPPTTTPPSTDASESAGG